MKYKAMDRVLTHDGAAIAERLDRVIELLEKLAHPLFVVDTAANIGAELLKARETLDAAEVRRD